MQHRRNWPDAAWHFDFDVPASLSDQYGELISIAGTVSLDTQGQLRAPHDLDTQLDLVMAELEIIADGAGIDLESVVKLVAFYVSTGEHAHDQVLEGMGHRFSRQPGPALTAIPVENLAFPGMMLEIEGYALADPTGAALGRSAPVFGTLKSGEWLFVDTRACRAGGAGNLARQATIAVENLHSPLSESQSSLRDVVRLNVYYNSAGAIDDLMTVGDAVAARFERPGPVITFVPLPTLARAERWVEIDAIAMPGREGEKPTRRELSASPG